MSAPITHQEIIDRMESLGREHSAAYAAELARIDKERESLRELCGGIGHFFARTSDPFLIYGGKRVCVFCRQPEGA